MMTDDALGAVVLQAPFTTTSSGDNVVVLGVSGKRIKIVGLFYVLNASANLTFKSSSTPISGPMFMTIGGTFYKDFIKLPINCNPGDSFVINADTTTTIGGMVWYIVS